MNPLLTVRTNQVPFDHLRSLCGSLHNSLRDPSASLKDRVKLEQQLWAEVKLLKNFRNQALLQYLIGYYHSILYQHATSPSINDLFQYHVLVRLGDLNRYLQRDDLAQYYYLNARNLFPLFGHAYNQLGLILAKPEASHNYYKCCYYYARAARSSDKSLTLIAESNLRIAAKFNGADLLSHLLNDDTSNQSTASDSDGSKKESPNSSQVISYPDSATNWFYLTVIAIAVDNILPIATPFLSFMKENMSTHRATVLRDNIRMTSIYCDRDSYILLATLDILLDWMKLSAHGAKLLNLITGDLRKIRTSLQSTLASIKSEFCLSQSPKACNQGNIVSSADLTSSSQGSTKNDSQSTLQDCHSSNLNTSGSSRCSSTKARKALPALPHDYVLKGFKPLDVVHRDILFFDNSTVIDLIHKKYFRDTSDLSGKDESVKFVDSEYLRQVLCRITTKMDSFGGRIKKKSRNIALESILSNMNQ